MLDLGSDSESEAPPKWAKCAMAKAAILAWLRSRRITPVALSLLSHVLILMILLFITYHLEKKQGLDLFLKMGESSEAQGSFDSVPTLAEPLDMPAIDVTQLDALTEPPRLTPELPRMVVGDLEFNRPPQLENSESLKGFGVSQFEGLSEKVQGVNVKIGDPQFTLIWDSDADLDLHVIEPDGSEIYWEFRKGKRGGELDVDDVDGQGPENVFWKIGSGPRGTYTWWVHYYGGFGGKTRRTKWQVRIKHRGQVEVFDGLLSKIDEKSPDKKFVLK